MFNVAHEGGKKTLKNIWFRNLQKIKMTFTVATFSRGKRKCGFSFCSQV